MLAETFSETLIKQAEGKIQSQVSQFLSFKEPLNKMTYHPTPEISNRAKQLYDKQITLESKMKRGLELIDEIKTSFDLSKTIEVGNIALEIDNHTRLVKIFLEGSSPVKTKSSSISPSSKKFLQYVVIGLGVFFIGNFLLKGRSV